MAHVAQCARPAGGPQVSRKINVLADNNWTNWLVAKSNVSIELTLTESPLLNVNISSRHCPFVN